MTDNPVQLPASIEMIRIGCPLSREREWVAFNYGDRLIECSACGPISTSEARMHEPIYELRKEFSHQ